MALVRIFLTPTCPYCKNAERLLARKGVSSVDRIDVAEDASRLAEMAALCGQDSVPQIFIGGRHVGGYDELVDLDLDGELDRLLAEG